MDWRVESDYDYTEDLCWEGWAWEFLRRHDDYIKSYDDFMNDGKGTIYTPPRNPNETEETWRRRCFLSYEYAETDIRKSVVSG